MTPRRLGATFAELVRETRLGKGDDLSWPAKNLILGMAECLIPVLLILAPSVVGAEDAIALRTGFSRIDEADLKRHVSTLASDAFEGREVGSRGGKAAAAYLRSQLKRIRESTRLQPEQTQEFGREYQNLIVRIPGSDEKLSQEVVIVGAHYDHVGYGKPSNSHGPFGQIHNGADDNASGTSAVLELIEAFASLEPSPPRTIQFVFWDGEEAGLLGSKHWVAHPTVPLSNIRFVLNLDMLGRLRNGHVVTGGWRSAPGLRTLVSTHNVNHELRLAFQPRVIADSDHHPFYAAGIPVIHLDTDKHDDYHRPSDDPDKINWDGLKRLTEFAYRITLDVASVPELPRFRPEAHREIPPSWLTVHPAVNPPNRVGAFWDPGLAQKNIAQIAQLTQDSPAFQGGLRVGDRVTRFGTWENGTFDDLKTTMQVVKTPVAVRVERPGVTNPINVSLTLVGTPVRLGGGWIDDAALPNCVVMTHVVADSPAARAGIATGDVILSMGGRPIASSEEMRKRVLEEPGPFQFRVERQGCIRDVTVNLFDQPAPQFRAVEKENLPDSGSDQ